MTRGALLAMWAASCASAPPTRATPRALELRLASWPEVHEAPRRPEESANASGEVAAKIVVPAPPDENPYDDPEVPAETDVPLPRITSVALLTPIHPGPGHRYGGPLGYLHPGTSVALRPRDSARRPDCPTAWYPVEPRGWICNDDTTILETSRRHLSPHQERMLRGLQSVSTSEGPLPYHYALSLGTPMYGRIPSAAEQKLNETMYGTPNGRLGPWSKGHDGLADGEPPPADPDVPWFLANGDSSPRSARGKDGKLVRRLAPRGSLISFSSSFEAGGRTWLVTPELAIVPADRVRVYRQSSFSGVSLGQDLSLPIAWTRKTSHAKFHLLKDGHIAAGKDSWEARTAVGLTGRRVAQDDHVLLETLEPDTYIDLADATLVEQASERPSGVGPSDKWIQISVTRGTLTAYEGERPVFATLISPGRGGLPRFEHPSNHELASRHNTPLGVYRIQYKDRYSVMSPDPEQKKFFISDVPYIQYFRGPFALHGAYWHDQFGEPMSGGCVNLSPADAEWLFGWTDPPVPSGWHAVRSGGPAGAGTVVEILP